MISFTDLPVLFLPVQRCPFIEKFSLEIETKYLNDGGETENVFNLTKSELRNQTVGQCSTFKMLVSK
jgi:hypothetical protein